eukprot:445072-Hanusia_phi.AAC.2
MTPQRRNCVAEIKGLITELNQMQGQQQRLVVNHSGHSITGDTAFSVPCSCVVNKTRWTLAADRGLVGPCSCLLPLSFQNSLILMRGESLRNNRHATTCDRWSTKRMNKS